MPMGGRGYDELYFLENSVKHFRGPEKVPIFFILYFGHNPHESWHFSYKRAFFLIFYYI